MKLSFLILTHNRPSLFKRCIESILQFDFLFPIEILVNNDSSDIMEIYDTRYSVKYFYNKSENLSTVYKNLFIEATGEYIYFIEDDDYLSKNFLKFLNLTFDLLYMNYKKVDTRLNFKPFQFELINTDFQLSQILFKKELLKDYEFPNDNNLHNDWRMFQLVKNRAESIQIINKIMYIQTCDGNDNISFPLLNKDNRWPNQNL